MTWGGWLKPKDVRGRESRTLAFVGLTWMLLCARFAMGGFSIGLGPIHFEVGSTPMVDFGAAVAAVLSIWLGREFLREKKSGGDS